MNDDNDSGTNKTANGSNNIDSTTKHIVTIDISTTTTTMSNNGLINTKVLGHIEHAKKRAISILANTHQRSNTHTHTPPREAKNSLNIVQNLKQ